MEMKMNLIRTMVAGVIIVGLGACGDGGEDAGENAGEAAGALPAVTQNAPAVDMAAMTQTETGLQYQDLEVGTGEAAVNGMSVSVHYTGWFLDGEKFDSSVDRGEPYDFPLGGRAVIQGWDQGVEGMRVGGMRRLVIPPDLAYGPDGRRGIPPNSTLVFDVKLLEVGG